MIVVKRNGTEVSFEKGKIHSALSRAFKEVYGKSPESKEGEELNSETNNVTADVVRRIKGKTIISVEEIQDVVEDVLMSYDHAVAKAYITYRFKHKIKRDISNTTDNVIMEMLGNKSEYWSSENSNKDSQLVTTQRDYIAGITSTDITKRLLLPRKVVEAHERGEIHFHDADYFIQPITNCCLVNLKDTLQNGTVMNKKAVNCSHRLWTATTISTQIVTAVASSQYGGTSINLGHLAPFVRKSYEALMKKYERFDKFTQKIFAEADLRKEIEDSVQTFNYQINTMSTTNGQTPFISVFMYLGDEDGEYKKEMAMLIEEFLKQRIKGIQNEQGVWVTQEFPKLLYVLEKDNMEGGEYEYLTNLAAKCASFRLAPDFISEKKMIELKNGDVYGCMG